VLQRAATRVPFAATLLGLLAFLGFGTIRWLMKS